MSDNIILSCLTKILLELKFFLTRKNNNLQRCSVLSLDINGVVVDDEIDMPARKERNTHLPGANGVCGFSKRSLEDATHLESICSKLNNIV